MTVSQTKDDMLAGLGLLTRLPVPGGGGISRPEGAWAWPMVGAFVGALMAATGALAASFGLPAAAVAGLVLSVGVLCTGGLHEDGLADTADGLWGGGTPQRRLAIMRDSRIGSYGVLAIVLVLGLKWAALTELAAAGSGHLAAALILAASVSRAPMAVMMRAMPPARSDGLSRMVGRPGWEPCLIGLGLSGLLILLLWPISFVVVLLVAAAPGLWLGLLARRRIGGQTGDILGATQALTECAVVLALAALV